MIASSIFPRRADETQHPYGTTLIPYNTSLMKGGRAASAKNCLPTAMPKTLLFVDGDDTILQALQETFCDSSFQVFTSVTGKEALDLLKQHTIDMLITDMNIPDMEAGRLLRLAKQEYPSTLRLILSNQIDERRIMEALQENLAKMYILKPWKDHNLRTIIGQILEIDDMLQTKNLAININTFEDLPTLVHFYNSLCSLIEKDSSVDQIAKFIEQDPSTAARILRVVNSGFFGLRTASLHQAIVYLGLINLKHITLSTAVFEYLNINVSSYYSKEVLWKHSGLTNRLTIQIYQHCFQRRIPESFGTAGLLHNIGTIFLMKHFHKEYRDIFQYVLNNANVSVNEVEQEILGISHQELGAHLLSWWDLPQPVIEAALFHHSPLDHRIIHKEVVACVHVADYYAWIHLKRNLNRFLHPGVFSILHTNREELDSLLLAQNILEDE